MIFLMVQECVDGGINNFLLFVFKIKKIIVFLLNYLLSHILKITIMKNLTIVLFLLISISSFSQNSLGHKLFNSLENNNLIRSYVKFDTVFSKSFVDSIKNYVVGKDTLSLPAFCYNNTPIIDLNDLMFCISETKVNNGFFYMNRITPQKNSSEQEILSLLTDELIYEFDKDKFGCNRININVFPISSEVVTTIYDPLELSITEEIDTIDSYFVILLLYN